jgi:hypothetical protein
MLYWQRHPSNEAYQDGLMQQQQNSCVAIETQECKQMQLPTSMPLRNLGAQHATAAAAAAGAIIWLQLSCQHQQYNCGLCSP